MPKRVLSPVIQALRKYLKQLNCAYEVHILINTKVSAAKDHDYNYMEL